MSASDRMASNRYRIATCLGELAVSVEGSGPVTVLWHSMLVDDRSWDAIAPVLAASRQVVRVTGPGHGHSAPVHRRFTLEECAVAGLDVLDALSIDGPVDWVGNAWGGHVGVVLAAWQPDRIRSLVAFNAPIAALARGEWIQMRALAIALRFFGSAIFLRRLVFRGLLSAQTRATRPDVVAYVNDCLVRSDSRSLAQAIVSISIHRTDLAPLLRRVPSPVCFVTTRADRFWSPAQAEAAAATMTDARVVTIEGPGHLTPLEAPDATLALLFEFCGRAGTPE